MFEACADEWEKYFAAALKGDTAAGGRGGWMGDKLQGAKFDTAFVESTNGAAKYACQQMQGRGAHGRQVARVLASQADLWGRWDLMDGRLQEAVLRCTPALREEVLAFTAECKELNAAADSDRKERQQRDTVKAAATSFAIAQALNSFDLWSVVQLSTELESLKFKFLKQDALEQQLAIDDEHFLFDCDQTVRLQLISSVYVRHVVPGPCVATDVAMTAARAPPAQLRVISHRAANTRGPNDPRAKQNARIPGEI